MKIIIEEYDPHWKELFEQEKEFLNSIFDYSIDIEHIGSTSVEGLGAKPIIDIMIGLKDFNNVDLYSEKIVRHGYKYVPKFDYIIPFRRFFVKEKNGLRIHHIHLVESGCETWERHLLFRDYLRENKEVRDEYHKLKKELSKREWKDRDEYSDAKSEFITHILGNGNKSYL